MGIEPTPKAWQAFVLPLYYGRSLQPILTHTVYHTWPAREAAGETQACGDGADRLRANQETWVTRAERTTGDFFCRSAKRAALPRSV